MLSIKARNYVSTDIKLKKNWIKISKILSLLNRMFTGILEKAPSRVSDLEKSCILLNYKVKRHKICRTSRMLCELIGLRWQTMQIVYMWKCHMVFYQLPAALFQG